MRNIMFPQINFPMNLTPKTAIASSLHCQLTSYCESFFLLRDPPVWWLTWTLFMLSDQKLYPSFQFSPFMVFCFLLWCYEKLSQLPFYVLSLLLYQQNFINVFIIANISTWTFFIAFFLSFTVHFGRVVFYGPMIENPF